MAKGIVEVTSDEEGVRFFASTQTGGPEFRNIAKNFGFEPILVKEDGKVLGTEVHLPRGAGLGLRELIETRTNLDIKKVL